MEETNSNKRILITGASGFVGGHLVEAALNRGYEIWAGVRASSDCSVLNDLNRGYGIVAKPDDKRKGERLFDHDRIRFIDLNYNDETALTQQLAAFKAEHGAWHYIIHNAGITKAVDKNDFFRVNAENTRRLLRALTASECQPEKFVLMSSLSTFGSDGDKTMSLPIRLEDQQKPDTVYGKSKLRAEQYVATQTDFPYVVLRPTGVFGPGDKDYLMQIQSVINRIDCTIGFSHQWLTFIYVEDLAEVAMLALENPQANNKAYFVSDGAVYSDKDFGRLIQLIIGYKRVLHLCIPVWMAYIACLCSEQIGKWKKKPMTLNTDKFHILKQRKWICSVDELQHDLGFTAPKGFHQRLAQTINWYRDNQWL